VSQDEVEVLHVPNVGAPKNDASAMRAHARGWSMSALRRFMSALPPKADIGQHDWNVR
jgi:hypothetical protein